MKTLVLVGLTMVTASGATAADAQRLGGAGAPYPMPGQHAAPNMPRPQPMPARSFPQQGRPPQAYPQQGYPQQGSPQPGRPQQGYPQPGSYPQRGYPQQGYPQRLNPAGQGSRWGGTIGGHWSGGNYAPGGWNAYRRPSRGWRVPNYWLSSNFYIGDFGAYGLSSPPQGYGWYRYYDDAVLLDARGKVYDSAYGLDWDGPGYSDGYDAGYEGGYGAQGGYAASDYGYAQGDAGGSAYVRQQGYASLPPVVQQGGVTTYQTGYPGYGGTTTVVTIQPTETVTTTTTEYVDEYTTHYAPRRVYRAKRVYRPVARPRCGCRRVMVEKPIRGS